MLNLTEEKIGPCLVALQVELEPARADSAMHDAAKRISRQMRIPGFRQGKAPYHVVLRTYGKDAVVSEAVEVVGEEILREALEQRNLNAYERPTVEIVKPEPLTLKYTVPTRPVVDLGGYRALRIERKPAEAISDEQVNRSLEQVRRAHATVSAVERPAQLGDTVRMDLKITSGETTLIDRKDTDVDLVEGEEDITPGFSAAMVGVTKDEARTINLLVPESDTASGLAGQLLNVSVTVHEVKEVALPALDDELAKTDGRFETLDELRADLHKNLQANAERAADDAYEGEAVKAVVAGAKIEYPDRMVDHEIGHQLDRLMNDVKRQGFTFDHWMRMNNLTLDGLTASMRPNVEERLRNSLVLYELAERENVRIEPDDIEAAIEEQAAKYPDELKKLVRDAYGGDEARVTLSLNLLQRRAVAKLVSITKGEGVLLPGDADAANRPSEVLVAS